MCRGVAFQMVSWLALALVAAVLPMAMGQSGPAAPTLRQISNGTSSWIIQSSGLPGAGAVLQMFIARAIRVS